MSETKKTGIASKELLSILTERGFNVTSASSSIDNISADSLVEEFASKKESASALKTQSRHKEALKELSEAMKVADDTELQDIQETLFSMIRMNPSLSELPEEARKHVLRAQEWKKEGNFGQAATEFKKAIQIAPYVAGLYYDSALMNAELKKYPEAIRYMNIYLKAAPDAPDARDTKDEIYKWEFKMEKGE